MVQLKLQSIEAKKIFLIDSDIVSKFSTLVKDMIEDGDEEDQDEIIPIAIDQDLILEYIINFITIHKDIIPIKPCEPTKRFTKEDDSDVDFPFKEMLKNTHLKDQYFIHTWLKKIMNCKNDDFSDLNNAEDLAKIFIGANFMHIDTILQICGATFAAIFYKRSYKEVKLLGITLEGAPEDDPENQDLLEDKKETDEVKN